MKRIVILPVLLAVLLGSCIKKDAAVSTTETVSYPTVSLANQYFSVTLNSSYPNIGVTVSDSFYNPCTYIIVDSSIHTNIAGLYIGNVSARNNEGFTTYVNFYVAATNISASLNLSGIWWPAGTTTGDSATVISEVANGLYYSSNLSGTADTSTSIAGGIFAVTNTTSIVFPHDNTTYASSGSLSMIPGDTTITYYNAITGGSVSFKKQ